MEQQKDLSERKQDPGRFPWPLVFIALAGLGLSAVFILFSFSDQFSNTDDAVTSAGNLTGPITVSGDTSAFTTDPLPDPRTGSVTGDGRAAVGQPAPDFTLPTLEGDTVSLSDYAGYPVLINFWATWCAPCRLEMPELVRAYNTHQDEGFVILSVNLTDQDSMEEVRVFVEEFDMRFPVLLDETGAVSDALYRLLGLPMSVFVDREGRIERIYIGLMTADQIDTFVSEILQ